MLIYDKNTGQVLKFLNELQDFDFHFKNYPLEFKSQMGKFLIAESNLPVDYKNYKIVNNQITKLSCEEILEIQRLGKLLTEEEILLEKLKPSQEEIQKAEETLKLLELLQEVM